MYTNVSPWTIFKIVRAVSECMTFLSKVLPDVPEPALYWDESDSRAVAADKGIISQMVLDFEPFHKVSRKGFLINMRMNMPEYKVHNSEYYARKIDQVNLIILCFVFPLYFPPTFPPRSM